MEPFYLSHEEFWEWFDRDPAMDEQIIAKLNSMTGPNTSILARQSAMPMDQASYHSRQRGQVDFEQDGPESKKMKLGCNNKKPIRHIQETEASMRCDSRFVIMYGKHRPGKKSKVWEGDGYLTLVNGVAHLSDLKGRMLEDPTILDDVDMGLIEDMGELLIGNTEVSVVELDK